MPITIPRSGNAPTPGPRYRRRPGSFVGTMSPGSGLNRSAGGAQGDTPIRIDRRQFIGLGAGLIALAGGGRAVAGTKGLRFGPPQPFGYEGLRASARTLAAAPYAPPPRPAPAIVQNIDFDAIQKIKFRPECALWKDGALPVRFFHLDKFNGEPVAVHAVENGMARPVLYEKDDFIYA